MKPETVKNHIKKLSPELQRQLKGELIYELKISYASLFRRLKNGFREDEIPIVRSVLQSYLSLP